jgi:hypothetical protein
MNFVHKQKKPTIKVSFLLIKIKRMNENLPMQFNIIYE